MNIEKKALIELKNVSVFSSRGALISGVYWTMHASEIWAITGANGSGKTLLAEVIAGKRMPMRGERHYNLPSPIATHAQDGLPPHARDSISLVSFDASILFKPFREMYYQKRFNASEEEDVPLVSEFLEQQAKRINAVAHLQALKKNLGEFFSTFLLGRRLNQLSNGETKKLLILLGLLKNPYLLILDQIFTGLDAENRLLLLHFIENLHAQGVELILICQPDEIPSFVNMVLYIKDGCVQAKPFQEFLSLTKQEKILTIPLSKRESNSKEAKPMPPGSIRAVPASTLEQTTELEEASDRSLKIKTWFALGTSVIFKHAVIMRNVSISYGSKRILSGINWKVKSGDKWVLSGPNGTGKSTLLSLITADHPQAYGLDLYLFDRKRGTGESIWDIKKMVGFMSPELQVYFPREQSVLQVVLSGLHDTLGLFKKAKPEEEKSAHFLLDFMEIKALRDVPFRQLSTGEQRLVLLGRALIKNPNLLILDEPCQGLDPEHRDHFINLIDDICRHNQHTLIYVSHYREEIPPCVEFEFNLPEGVSRHMK